MNTSKIFITIMAMFGLLYFNSCSTDQNAAPAIIQVSLVDAPADYEQVNIEITDVQINPSSDQESGWVSLEGALLGSFDLLKLTNETEAFLGSIELPQGELSQLRLVLGSANNLVVEGQTKNLTVPSGSQSGLKLNINQPIESGITYKLVIDFDAARSIVKAGASNNYLLKPVLRAKFEAQTGAITGVVSPTNVEAIVYGIKDNDSISTYLDETAAFTLKALDPGSYEVVIIPSYTSSSSTVTKTTVSDVLVEIGSVTDLGTVIISQ